MEVIICEGESSSYDQPDKKVYEGHTGNAGPTLKYRYHRAMVVVWPTFLSDFVACKVGLWRACWRAMTWVLMIAYTKLSIVVKRIIERYGHILVRIRSPCNCQIFAWTEMNLEA